ncbi:hypothetical protein BC628DRAFT_1313032 [Trametes gibbosa]|nr:hypothetical protein BC628DRAFT_1313032 [Trametes gibbosa]
MTPSLNPLNLPVELYAKILCELPAAEPATLKTVVNFLSTSSLLRAAALESSVWARLYRAWFPHDDEVKEQERRERLQGNVRLMFIERCAADRRTLRLLDRIRTDPWSRHALGPQLVQEMSFDVCDALQREMQLPIPKVFRDPCTDSMHEDAAPEALPRRFWANAMLGATARYHAMKKWRDLCVRPEEHTFEDVLLGFSAFTDSPLPHEIVQHLDTLAASCRDRLCGKDVQVDPEEPDYDLRSVVLAIRAYIHEEGFALATGDGLPNPLSQFPHYVLGPGRSSTLPMSINWVFAAICRRLGVQAAPTNTPGRVLSYITSPLPTHGDILLDVCSHAPPTVFSSKNVETMLAEAGMSADAEHDAVLPARLPAILQRAAYNICNASFPFVHGNMVTEGPLQHAVYAANVAIAVVYYQDEAVRRHASLRMNVPQQFPLDVDVILDVLRITPAPATQLTKLDMFGLGDVLSAFEDSPNRRSPSFDLHKLFIGQVITNPPLDYACVLLWKVPSPALAYTLLSRQGISEWQTADEKIPMPWVAPLTVEDARELRRAAAYFDQYFEDVIIPCEDGTGGRFIPSKELQAAYPDDLDIGARWTTKELEKAGTGEAGVAH